MASHVSFFFIDDFHFLNFVYNETSHLGSEGDDVKTSSLI